MLVCQIPVQHRYQFLLFHSEPPVCALNQLLVCFDNSFSCYISSRFITAPIEKCHNYDDAPKKKPVPPGDWLFHISGYHHLPGNRISTRHSDTHIRFNSSPVCYETSF